MPTKSKPKNALFCKAANDWYYENNIYVQSSQRLDPGYRFLYYQTLVGELQRLVKNAPTAIASTMKDYVDAFSMFNAANAAVGYNPLPQGAGIATLGQADQAYFLVAQRDVPRIVAFITKTCKLPPPTGLPGTTPSS